MQIQLREISEKAKRQSGYRFLNLYTMLNESNLKDSWRYLNKNSATGVDGVSAKEYEQELEGNIVDLVGRLKKKGYRSGLIRRKNIPKGNGKTRPLGIPITEDKLLQCACKRIVETIYEADFYPNSYGYRPKRGALDAVKKLTQTLQFGRYNWVVEADIRGFFDNIDHDILLSMLEERINDSAFIGLLRKWLKAGILEEGQEVTHPGSGTPQGGIISPVLANIYLHHALDEWFEEMVKPNLRGQAYLVRYADDFIAVFQYRDDAERYYKTLPKRLAKYGLDLAVEKSGIEPFSPNRRDSGRFDFLGFEFYWGVNRRGRATVRRRTSRSRLRKSLAAFSEWIKGERFQGFGKLIARLNRKLRGYYNYYGLIGNSRGLREFNDKAVEIMYKWLNRRSQRRSYNWYIYGRMIRYHGILKPRITERYPKQRDLFGLVLP
jgi:RNA-directed DNA polymerase